jgi:hypothetical protein
MSCIILFYLFFEISTLVYCFVGSRVQYIFHACDISMSIMATSKSCFIILHSNFVLVLAFPAPFIIFRWSSNDVFAMTKVFLVIYWKLSIIFGME